MTVTFKKIYNGKDLDAAKMMFQLLDNEITK